MKPAKTRKVKRTVRRVTDEKRGPEGPRAPTIIAEEGDSVICCLTLPSDAHPMASESSDFAELRSVTTDDITDESVSFEVREGNADDHTRLLLQMKRNAQLGSSSSSSSSSRHSSPSSSSRSAAPAPIPPIQRFNDTAAIRLIGLSSSDDETPKQTPKKRPGSIVVDVIEARGLIGTSNPCCRVTVKELRKTRLRRTTKTIHNSRSPIWDFKCQCRVSSIDAIVVSALLLDGKEKRAKMKRSLAGIELGTVIEDWFELTGLDGSPAGELHMRVRFGAAKKEDDVAGILHPEIVIKNGKRKHRYRHHKRRSHAEA